MTSTVTPAASTGRPDLLPASPASPTSDAVAHAASFPGGSVSGATNQTIWKAASDFEAMTIGQLLQPMFDTVDLSKGMFGGGVGESTFRPMMVTEISKQIEQNGGLGLTRTIYRQMLEIQEKGR